MCGNLKWRPHVPQHPRPRRRQRNDNWRRRNRQRHSRDRHRDAFFRVGVAILLSTPSPSIRDLARALLAASQPAPSSDTAAAELVNENLRLALTRFAGTDGFASLLRRALVLASAELPVLQGAKVGAAGRVEGLERMFPRDDAVWQEAAVAITAQLLELLVTFIGEPLTRRLVREACPETSPEE